MSEKLDPMLQAMSDRPDEQRAGDDLGVIIALNVEAGPTEINGLEESGVTTRSIIGDIVTGKISTENLSRLEELSYVLKVEASTPLGPG